jgi:hypothetical protein
MPGKNHATGDLSSLRGTVRDQLANEYGRSRFDLPSFETLTGKGWVLMLSDIVKSTDVKGFQDAVTAVAAGLQPEIRDSVRDNCIAKGFTAGDYVHELDELFKHSEIAGTRPRQSS